MIAIAEKPIALIHDLKRATSTAAHSSKFYHWLLSSGEAPSAIAVKMIDPWPGDAENGRALCRGLFKCEGSTLAFSGDFWFEAEDHPHLRLKCHEFSFLRDLRAAGGDQARKLARHMVDGWIGDYDRWDADIWRADIIGERISYWLSFYDFFCGSADEDFQARYYASLTKQAKHLSRALPGSLKGVALLKAAKGLAFAGFSFPGRESWILQAFEIILAEIPQQILSDGSHASRSPKALADTLQILLDLRCGLNRASLPVPEIIQHAIDRAGQALRFFRYADKKLALFHGGQEGDITLMDALQTQSASVGKAMKSLPEAGFERVQLGRSLLMLDTASIADSPCDMTMHSSPLSFEFAYGKERIFVNCGGHPSAFEWQQVLRHTAAHTALTLDDRPAHDFKSDGHIARRHGKIKVMRNESREHCLLDATHNAYVSINGISHRRRIYLGDQGLDLRGEDTLTAEIIPTHAMPAIARFHLHPRVLATVIKDGEEVILRLPSGAGWKFSCVGAKLSLENSIYLGSGAKPVKTRQLVLSTCIKTETTQIKWALQKEMI
ncbi:MAG: heparinase [Micavibrio aeruginosavorus]|uniref:Heparinase n=1 Tax=Micavibrio aeruginosavorus TaxID=349221 RepID=A0A2W5FHA6_9BACT|nr:MAG: heparinase [Micavibrio aeruginosavorus]